MLFNRTVRREGSALFRIGMFLIIDALECPTISFPAVDGDKGARWLKALVLGAWRMEAQNVVALTQVF